MSTPKVVWCDREDCFYNSNGTCSKYNITITSKGCISFSDGRYEKRCGMGDVDEIYRDEEKSAYDAYIRGFLH